MKSAKGGGYPGASNSRGWRKISSAGEGRGGPRLPLKREEPEALSLQECVGCVQTGMCRGGVAGDGAGLERVSGFARPEGSHRPAGLNSQPPALAVPSSGRPPGKWAETWESEAWTPATMSCHRSWPQFPPPIR